MKVRSSIVVLNIWKLDSKGFKNKYLVYMFLNEFLNMSFGVSELYLCIFFVVDCIDSRCTPGLFILGGNVVFSRETSDWQREW